MAEQLPGHDHRTQDPGNSLNLPSHGFEIDRRWLEDSANTVRGMAELQAGLQRIGEDPLAYSSVVLTLAIPEERDALRGGVLMHELLIDSVEDYDFEEDSKTRYADSTIRGLKTPERQAFIDAQDELIRARSRTINPQLNAQTERAAFTAMVDEILDTFEVSEAVDSAVENLTVMGQDGKEETTDLSEARYGAALVLVGVGGK